MFQLLNPTTTNIWCACLETDGTLLNQDIPFESVYSYQSVQMASFLNFAHPA